MIGSAKSRSKRILLRAAIHGDWLATRALGPSYLDVWRQHRANSLEPMTADRWRPIFRSRIGVAP